MRKTKKEFWIINGPNINLFGLREKEIYGDKTYVEYLNEIEKFAKENKIKVKEVQTNSEGKIIDVIHYALYKGIDGIILNAGAYTHYSYAIRDAISAVGIPCVEVHISDINAREDFRKVSVIKDVCIDTILGEDCYIKALSRLMK